MPKFLGLDKKKWLWVGVAAAAVIAYVLLSRGSGGGQAAGPAGGEQPIQGGNFGGYPSGNTPAGYFDQGEQAAHFYSNDLLNAQQQLRGATRGVWEQVAGGWVNTGIKNPSARGTFLSEQAAMTLGPQNKGPYAQGKSFLQKFSDVLNVGAAAYGSYIGARAAVPSGGGYGQSGGRVIPWSGTPSDLPNAGFGTPGIARAQGRRRLG